MSLGVSHPVLGAAGCPSSSSSLQILLLGQDGTSSDCTVLLSGLFVFFGLEETGHNTSSLESYVKF